MEETIQVGNLNPRLRFEEGMQEQLIRTQSRHHLQMESRTELMTEFRLIGLGFRVRVYCEDKIE